MRSKTQFSDEGKRMTWKNRIMLGCLLCLLLGDARAQDWPSWRGPEQNGISRERGLISDWSLDGKNILWQAPTGGRATPVILGDRVYLDCRTPEDVLDPIEKINAGEQVVCWDLNTGEVLWRHRFNVFQTDIATARVGWASMCGDPETGNVYLHTVSGIFRCYDRDGKILWERSLVEEFGEILGYGGRIQNPVVDEDLVIISFLAANWGASRGPGPMHYYYAFDKRTGDLQWVTAPGVAPEGTNYSIPVITVVNGQRIMIGGNGDGGIYAMNPRTGKRLWGFLMSKSAINASPVVAGNRLFVAHGQDNVDSPEFGSVRCIDLSKAMTDINSATIWRKDGIKADYASPLYHDGILYVMSDTGNLFALDADTGEELWIHNCGTIGKGSPVWADGKLYQTEVNGNVWILKPSREKCEVLSHVRLPAVKGNGDDEIFASFAISKGRCILVTRDRTICLGTGTPSEVDPIPEMPAEASPSDEVAMIQLRPYETVISAERPQTYKLYCFDPLGHLIKVVDPELTLSPELSELKTSGSTVSTPVLDHDVAGTVSAKYENLEAVARIRVFNGTKEWYWNFDDLKGTQTPPTWLRAFAKAKPVDFDGNTALGLAGIGSAKGRPSHVIFFGSPTMKNYTIEADVHMTPKGRTLPNIGVIANRYTFLIKGNYNKVEVQSWQAHLHNAKEVKFEVTGNQWYTLKFTVKVQGGKARLFGKAWKVGDDEPSEWTLEHVDPNPNETGSPGLYVYATNDCAFDNVRVTFHD